MGTSPKIAFWLPSFATTGLQTSTIRVADALARQGIIVDIVVSRNQGSLSSLVEDPVRIIDLNLRSPRLGRGLLRAMWYVLREKPYAMCACSGSGYLLAALVCLVRARTQIWIWELSTRQYRQVARKIEARNKDFSSRMWRAIVKTVYSIAQSSFITMAHGVITYSQVIAEEICEDYALSKDKVHVIYNACLSGKMAVEFRKMRKPEEIKPVIVSIGRLSARKELDVLLRAFRLLRDQRQASLLIIGDGPCRQKLKEMIGDLNLSDHVELAGFKVHPFGYLDHADLFVLSSRAEPFGNVLVEAMAFGMPVVSTDSTGPREILDRGRYGALVPVGDHVALAAAMAETLENPPAPDVLRMRAMDFHAERIASQYLEVLGVRVGVVGRASDSAV